MGDAKDSASASARSPGTRWRLVTTQGLQDHVSTVVLSEEEAREHLEIEADIHERFGREVSRGEEAVVCRKYTDRGLIERTVTIRESTWSQDEIT